MTRTGILPVKAFPDNSQCNYPLVVMVARRQVVVTRRKKDYIYVYTKDGGFKTSGRLHSVDEGTHGILGRNHLSTDVPAPILQKCTM